VERRRQAVELQQPSLSLCALACPNEGRGPGGVQPPPPPSPPAVKLREIPLAFYHDSFIWPAKGGKVDLPHPTLPPFLSL